MATVDPNSSKSEGITLRPGTEADYQVMLKMQDTRIEWLVSQGRTQQWGTEPRSDDPVRIQQAVTLATSGGTWFPIERDAADGSEQLLGCLTVGVAPPPYVSPATEPELYINYLITDPKRGAGRGIGDMLLEKAKALARDKGVKLLRLDCYSGGDFKLVRWYQSRGFEKQEAFEAKGWPGQVLTMRL